jgi:hypothetical protein
MDGKRDLGLLVRSNLRSVAFIVCICINKPNTDVPFLLVANTKNSKSNLTESNFPSFGTENTIPTAEIRERPVLRMP